MRLATALVLLVFLSAAACGSGSEPESFAGPVASNGPYSLVFSGSADDDPVDHLYAARSANWRVRALPAAFDDIGRPVWSPTYDHFVDVSGTVIRSDGTGRRELGVSLERGFPWSRDGELIVYSHDAFEQGPIFITSVSGGNPRHVADGSLPQWATDGRIYYKHAGSISALEPRSADTEIVTKGAGWVLGYERWSPDGRRVVYDVGVEDARSLFVLELETPGEPTALLVDLDPPIVDVHAYAWAPDGEHLAVIAGRNDPSAAPLGPGTYGIRWELHIVDVSDGSSDKLLDVEAHELAWSPDGKWIALERYWGFDAERQAASDIWLVRPDGTELRQVTDGRDPGKDWDHTTGTHYRSVTWVPDTIVATMERR